MMKRSKFINHAGSWRSKCVGSKQSSVSLQIQKGIVDLGLSTLIKLLLVPKVQLALKDEGLEFWGVGTSEWVGSQSFGLDEVVFVMISLSISLANTAASLLMAFIIKFSSVASPGVSLSIGSMCAELGFVH